MYPKILVVEYNSAFGPDCGAAVEYADYFDFMKAHPTQFYYDVSIAGWRNVLEGHGYRFGTVDRNGVNAFFVDPRYFDPAFRAGGRGLAFAKNGHQLSKFRIPHERQFALIAREKFVTI